MQWFASCSAWHLAFIWSTTVDVEVSRAAEVPAWIQSSPCTSTHRLGHAKLRQWTARRTPAAAAAAAVGASRAVCDRVFAMKAS
jgi:hypothetical protein